MLKLVPYHFVPLGKNKSLSAPVNPFDKSLLEGKISCTLTIKTPLFIPNTSGEPKARDNAPKTRVFYSLTQLSGEISERSGSPKVPVILGSSIRGMLRNVHEAASNGCMHILSGKRNDAHWNCITCVAKKMGDFAPCTGKDNDLCPTCSLFGMVGRGYEEKTHAGRIRVSDAKAQPDTIKFGEFRWLPPQMEPKISAVEFYTYILDDEAEKWDYRDQNCCKKKNGCKENENVCKNKNLCINKNLRLKGRKFYWHHEPIRNRNDEDRDDKNKKFCSYVQPIQEGTFTFDIYFDGITEDELRQLAALINLKGQDGFKCQFKLGNAKAQGYGSVETGIQSVSIRRLALKNGNILYQQENVTSDYQDISMEDAFHSSLTDLMTILDPRTLGNADVRVEYPSQGWYRNETTDGYSRSDYIASHRLGTIAKVKEEAEKNPGTTSIGSYIDPLQGNKTQSSVPVQYSEEDMQPVDDEEEWAVFAAKYAKPKKDVSARASNKKKK